jgi:hypothetical protein
MYILTGMLIVKHFNWGSYYRGHIKRVELMSCVSHTNDNILCITYPAGVIYVRYFGTNFYIELCETNKIRITSIRVNERHTAYITHLMMEALRNGVMCRFLPRIKKHYRLKHFYDRTYTIHAPA